MLTLKVKMGPLRPLDSPFAAGVGPQTGTQISAQPAVFCDPEDLACVFHLAEAPAAGRAGNQAVVLNKLEHAQCTLYLDVLQNCHNCPLHIKVI